MLQYSLRSPEEVCLQRGSWGRKKVDKSLLSVSGNKTGRFSFTATAATNVILFQPITMHEEELKLCLAFHKSQKNIFHLGFCFWGCVLVLLLLF